MIFAAGAAALLAAVLLYAWAARLHHRADAPDWARGQLFASVTGLVLVGLVPVGAGLLAYGYSPVHARPEIAVLAVLGLLAALVWPRHGSGA